MNDGPAPVQTSAVMKRPLTSHTDIARYCPWDAQRRAAPNDQAVRILAEEFSCSVSLIEKGKLPHGGRIDQGRKSIPARIHDAIARCHLEAGVPLLDAASLIRHPARKIGFRLAPTGAARVPADMSAVLPTLSRTTGELAAYLAESLVDHELDALERVGLRDRLHAALDAIVGVEVFSEVYPQ